MALTNSVTNYDKKPVHAHGDEAELQCFRFSIDLATTDLQSGDTWNLGYLPIHARVHGGWLKATDMDSATALAINIGDAGDADRYFAASDIGQAGGNTQTIANTGLDYLTTAKTLIIGAPSTSATTAVAGTLSGSIWYVVEDSATS